MRYITITLFVLLCTVNAYAESAAPTLPEIRIGLLTQLSGPFATVGESCRQGYELARKSFAPEDKIGGRTIRFIYGDTKGEAAAGLTEFKRVVEVENAIAVVTDRSQVGMALNPQSAQRHIPLMGIVGHPDFINQNPYAFRFWPKSEFEGVMTAQKLIDLKINSLSVINLEDQWTESYGKALQENYTKLGGKVLFSSTIPGNFGDFNTIITKLIGAQSDAVFLNLGVPQMGPIIKRLREQGFKKTIFTNYWSSNKDVMAVVGKEGMNGVVYDIPKSDWPIFSKKLKEQFQVSKPTGNNYSCYTGLATLLTALAKNATVISGEDVHKSLLATSSVPLADNNLEIVGREAQMKIAFYRFVDGETEELN